jgi:hypothetical protein
MVTDILTRLRDSRENPSVLQIRILNIRSIFIGAIFVFEGRDDVAVYEEWFKEIAFCPTYEPLPADGKKQVLGLLMQLTETAHHLLKGVYFFIDRDFDPEATAHPQLHELQAYSIENMLCTSEVLDSLLKDELRCAGDLNTRSAIHESFNSFCSDVSKHCEEVNLHLFAASRLGKQVKTKPEKIGAILNITLDLVSPSYERIENILTLNPPLSSEEIQTLKIEYDGLPLLLKDRGKYRLDAFRKWLRLITEDAKSANPTKFPKQNSSVGDAGSVGLRRLASGSKAPQTLFDFCSRHFGEEKKVVDASLKSAIRTESADN